MASCRGRARVPPGVVNDNQAEAELVDSQLVPCTRVPAQDAARRGYASRIVAPMTIAFPPAGPVLAGSSRIRVKIGWCVSTSIRFIVRAATSFGVTLLILASAPWNIALATAELTARFESVPTSHDGSTKFTLELYFSEEVPVSYRTLRDSAFEIGGGAVLRARRLQKGSNVGWRITVRPDTNGDITLSLPVRACDATGAICAADDRALSEAVSATVPGPSSQTQEVSITVATDATTRSITPASDTVTEGTAAVFTLTRTGSLASALTVNVDVSETDAMLKGTPPATVTFGADLATAELSVETEDDEVAESASVITASLSSGNGYSIDSGATSATVTVEDNDAAPVITSTGPFSADENGTAIATLTATDDDTATSDLSWSVTGGADQNKVTLSTRGVLAFQAAKDFETPDDADGDGDYEITVRVTDGANPVEAALTIRLTDVDEVAPTVTVTSDATAPVSDMFDVTVTFSEPVSGFERLELEVTNGSPLGWSAGSDGSQYTAVISPVPGTPKTIEIKVPAGVATDAAGNPNAASSPFSISYDQGDLGSPPGAPVPTVQCSSAYRPWSPDPSGQDITTARISVKIVFSEGVGELHPEDVSLTRPPGIGIFPVMVSSPSPVGTTDFSYGVAFFGGAVSGDVAVSIPANVTTDMSGTSNTVSNMLYIAPNQALSVADANATEETDGTIDFEVTLDARNDCSTVTVDWATADGTATAGEDYTVASGTLTFGPGETTKTVRIAVLDDTNVESGETLTLRLSNPSGDPSGASIDDAEATGTITDDDSQIREVSITAATDATTRSITPASDTVTEGTAAVFTLTRTGSLASALTVNVDVSETGAMLKDTPATTVTFDANSATAELSVATEDDEVAESASVITATLEAGSDYSMDSGASSATVTVEDDDATPVVTTASPIVTPENGASIATLTATDDDTPVADIAWSIAGGADQNKVILSTRGVLAFQAAKDFEAPDDADGDGDYEITVRVTDGANPVETALTIRLTDVDEVAPTVTVTSDATAPVSDMFDVTVTFSEPVSGFERLELEVTNGSPLGWSAGSDGSQYTAVISPVPGTPKTIEIKVPAGVATDAAGNPNAASSSFSISYDQGDLGSPPGAPVPTVQCSSAYRPWSPDPSGQDITTARISVKIVFSEGVGELHPEDVSLTRPPGIGIFPVMVSSPSPVGTTDFSYGVAFFGGAVSGDVAVSIPANVTTDMSGTSNTVSNMLYIAPNQALSVADANATEETDGTIDFEVTLDARNDCSTVTVDWATADGTATAGEDYTVASGTLTFGPGETTKTVRIAVLDDTNVESGETLTLRLSNPSGDPSGVSIDDTEATGTITDDDSQTREVSITAATDATTRSITPASDTVTEGTAAVFTLTRTGSLASALTVNVDVSETDAMLKGTPPATVTFGADLATAELSVETEDDEVAESASVITASLSSGNGYSIDSGATSATVTVEDDDAEPVIADTGPFTVDENETPVTTLTATDDDTPVADLAWSIAGGADQNKVTLSTSGVLAFQAAKDFEAPDDADGDGDYEITVRVTDAANPVEATLTVRLADVVDEVAPALSSASVDSDTLTLAFSETLDRGSTPGSDAFAVAVGGTARGVSQVAINESAVTLTLASAVVAEETVTVGYTVPTGVNANPLRDAVGNPATAFSGQAVTNVTPSNNAAPTGLPTISGTARVGETLTASSTGISDADGLVDATFTWQWLANDGTSDADIAGATGSSYTLTSAEAGKTVKVRATFTDDGDTEETLVSDPTATVAMANTSPTGLPTILGSARVGETLTASANGIADDDGLTNANFAWQWIANDGTSDADIVGATAETYTLTSAEVGKTIKVRVTFTDDQDTEEALVSEATAQVAAALPVVSIAAASSPVTEGGAASFTLSRTGDTAASLTVSVAVSEAGSVVSGTPASTVTFAAGDAEETLSVATDDDSAAEADGRVTATIAAGTGYEVDAEATSAGLDVYDNDEAASTAVETLWTSTLTVQDIGGALLGYIFGNNLSPNGWSEDGTQFRADSLHYFTQYQELSFTLSAGASDPGQLTLHLDDLQVELSGASGEKYFYWTVAHPGWQAGQTVAVKLTRADPEAVVDAGPGVSVADAEVQEAEGAVLAFEVTLAEAQNSAVSVRYATADGTATAGADYEAVSGAVRFAPGETRKTVSVRVLNDAHDEGRETLTLALSRPFGAELADGEATGTIVNTDPMPKAWIARFGRTVGSQVVEAITARFDDGGPSRVTVGGMSLGGSDYFPTQRFESNEWDTEVGAWQGAREMTERELLLGSSFHLASEERADGGPAFAAWGRVASDGFEADVDDVEVDGDVTTGLIGFDVEWDRMLAGLLLSQSRGEGSYALGAELGNDRGSVESTLTGVYPYARLAMSERVSAWGVAGVGRGELTLRRDGGTRIDTDLAMRMGAVGVKGTVLDGSGPSAIGLNMKSDAMWVRTESDGAEGLESAEADVTRLRFILEAERQFDAGDGATFAPTAQVGLRHDGGDAETGTGVELGAGMRYASGALTVDGQVRALVAHEASGYEEWGASGAIRLNPNRSGRGLSLTVAPSWGNAASGMEQLWSARDATPLAGEEDVEAAGRLEATVGYGMPVLGGRFTGTPEFGVGLSDGGRDWRLGWRLGVAGSGRVDFGLGVEATRREPANDDAPENRIGLTARMRW